VEERPARRSPLTAEDLLGEGGKARWHLTLEDPVRLLEALSVERPLSKLLVARILTEESDAHVVELAISKLRSAGNYALTTFSAFARYTQYYIAYPMIHVHADRP